MRGITHIIILLALWLVAMRAGADDGRDKMSPMVRRAAVEHRQAARRVPTAGDGRTICAFVRADTAEAEGLLGANGCRIYDRRGDILIAEIPLDRLSALAASPSVSRIEASSPCRLTMDTTVTIVRAAEVHAGNGLPQAYTGQGVVVGVMDVGFDLTHPTFRDRTATGLRIGAFWDQIDRDTTGSGYPVGRDYVGHEALAAKRHSTDAHLLTHGTHTAGIAAGNGYDSPYTGMAPESEICLVNNAVTSDIVLIDSADLYKYTSATDALGFKYIFDYAAERGMPCVASFSEGYYVGLDGEDSLFCDYLGRLTGPGRIIVASAGNEAVKLNRLRKPAGTAEAGSFVSTGGTQPVFYVRADGPFRLRLEGYGGQTGLLLRVESDSCAADSSVFFGWEAQDNVSGGTAEIYRYASAFAQGDTIYQIVLTLDEPITSDKRIALVAEGEGSEVEVRATGNAVFVNSVVGDVWSAADCAANVLAPGCFPTVITVGATIHRTGFTNYRGEYMDYTQPGRNDGVRAWYSSVGPGTDGGVKPDVMAPGSNVVSAYSSFYIEQNPKAHDISSDVEHFEFEGRTYAWNSNAGTSMAAPVAAGAIALWLQARPDLTPEMALDVISRTSRQPESGLDYPNNYYGYGEIDVYAGLLRLLGIDGIEGLEAAMPRGVSISYEGGGRLRLRFSDTTAAPAAIRVWTTGGQQVFSGTAGQAGESDVSVQLPGLPAGIYAVQVAGAAGGVSGSVLIRVND